MKDYYRILGVSSDADEIEIKTAFRKLALRNHPDTNQDDPHAEARFKEINEAYDILSHRDKRDRYDLGHNPEVPFRSYPFDHWADSGELFPGFRCRGGGFGRGLGRRKGFFRSHQTQPAGFASAARPDMSVHDLTLTFREASEGTERDIRLHTGRRPLVFTVAIPGGVQDGTLLSFRHPLGGGRSLELLFRVKITA